VGPNNALPDWWKVDIRPFANVDEVVDLTQPWPWRDLEYVHGEHFLEHLAPGDAVRFLVEAARALRPGGRIRLSTPGLEWVWRTHFDPSREGEAGIQAAYGANRAFHGWGHKFLYSRPMLTHVLEGCGFSALSFHRYGESDHSALRGMERHADYGEADGWPSVWIVEAVPDLTAARSDELAREIDFNFDRYVRAGH
jgi:predicted SAM-dependent methyltransferase